MDGTTALRGRTAGRGVALALLLLLLAGDLEAAKTDVVIFRNGDRLTGEVKKLERGKLRFKTDATGTIEIEWDEVAHLSSESTYQVEHKDGTLQYGRLEATPNREVTRVVGEKATREVPHPDLVLITPIKQKFWGRVDGSVSFGYSFTKSSNVTQFTLGADAEYRSRRRRTGFQLSSIVTEQETGTTDRIDLGSTYQRIYRNRHFAVGGLAFQRNQELGIDLRILLSGGPGRYLIKNNRNELMVGGGLAVNREGVTDSTDVDNSLEGWVRLSYRHFRYDTPESSIRTELAVIPSITEWDRVRVEFDASVRQEIFTDFFWDLSYFHSYDSVPPNQVDPADDYGIVTSLGYSF
jgi:hypothetical protein